MLREGITTLMNSDKDMRAIRVLTGNSFGSLICPGKLKYLLGGALKIACQQKQI